MTAAIVDAYNYQRFLVTKGARRTPSQKHCLLFARGVRYRNKMYLKTLLLSDFLESFIFIFNFSSPLKSFLLFFHFFTSTYVSVSQFPVHLHQLLSNSFHTSTLNPIQFNSIPCEFSLQCTEMHDIV